VLGRILRWPVLALALAVVAGYAAINWPDPDEARWHVDPTDIALRGTPNEFLAAPPGTTEAEPRTASPSHPISPHALLSCFDKVAQDFPRVSAVAGDVASGVVTYVQRSAIVGFPDYVSVKAVPVQTDDGRAGSALVIYSRSRFGYGDFGVNEARVIAWLKEAAAIC